MSRRATKKKFFFVDHSLTEVGGHHYEQAIRLCSAFESLDFEVVLAVHKEFDALGSIPENWTVLGLFEFSLYDNWDLLAIPEHAMGHPYAEGSLSQLYERRKKKRASSGAYIRALRELFALQTLRGIDHVFLATLSEFDLVSLLRYLQSAKNTEKPCWHLRFHFPIFAGRSQDYQEQLVELNTLRAEIVERLSKVPGRKLHFYGATQRLVDQFNRLGIATFNCLPYPVPENLGITNARESVITSAKRSYGWSFHEYTFDHMTESDPGESIQELDRLNDRDVKASMPLKVTCAGPMRDEKGLKTLPEVVRALWPEFLSKKKVRLHLQCEKTTSGIVVPTEPDPGSPADNFYPIVYEDHPLRTEDYVQLILTTDIGLFLYDQYVYYARSSGVLDEMLSAGIPVIVPAGTWLAKQVAEPIFRHLEQLPGYVPVIEQTDLPKPTERHVRVPVSGEKSLAEGELVFGGGDSAVAYELRVPASATDCLVQFFWSPSSSSDNEIAIFARQLDGDGTIIGEFQNTIQGRGLPDKPVSAIFKLKSNAHRLHLFWSSAWDNKFIVVSDVQHLFLYAHGLPGGHCPGGSVGLIFSNPAHLPAVLLDMISHIDHYRASVGDFSHHYSRRCHPVRVALQLLQV